MMLLVPARGDKGGKEFEGGEEFGRVGEVTRDCKIRSRELDTQKQKTISMSLANQGLANSSPGFELPDCLTDSS